MSNTIIAFSWQLSIFLTLPTFLVFISSWLNAWLPDISLIKSALYTNETHPCVYCHLPSGASSCVLRVALRCVASHLFSSHLSFVLSRLSVYPFVWMFCALYELNSSREYKEEHAVNKQSESSTLVFDISLFFSCLNNPYVYFSLICVQ